MTNAVIKPISRISCVTGDLFGPYNVGAGTWRKEVKYPPVNVFPILPADGERIQVIGDRSYLLEVFGSFKAWLLACTRTMMGIRTSSKFTGSELTLLSSSLLRLPNCKLRAFANATQGHYVPELSERDWKRQNLLASKPKSDKNLLNGTPRLRLGTSD